MRATKTRTTSQYGSLRPERLSPYHLNVRYRTYLSRGRIERRVWWRKPFPTQSLLVREMQLGNDAKPGDEFPFKSEVYVITAVKPGFGKFEAILFADLVGDSASGASYKARLDS